ncbi:MAG: molecular chaperone TorD family protein [Gammaproteobacteria bacterium]|nr:molecular chaperone TorD family protein [Gammaproteobacteria bacterium]
MQVTLGEADLVTKEIWNEQGTEESIEGAQAYRAGAYGLLAALLRSPPDQAVLEHIAALSEVSSETDELSVALSMLGLAASHCDIDAIDDEYHTLFIGIGRGELVPYGSWYLTGFLMEKPLGVLRDDLASLGFERNNDVSEPEDHVAALCEVMALMIGDVQNTKDGEGYSEQQARFFEAHIGSWADKFFKDLTESKSAVFYRSVGRLGLAFIEFEKRYLSMSV